MPRWRLRSASAEAGSPPSAIPSAEAERESCASRFCNRLLDPRRGRAPFDHAHESLGERAHECHAVYIKNEDTQLNRIRPRNGGAVRCLNAARYFDARALVDFAAHISRIRPSAIVAANPYALMYSSLALRLSRLRAPLIVTFHSTRLLGAKEQLQMLIYRLFFWTSDCLVFVCERQRRSWLRRGVFSRRNEVIYNGVDTEEFCDKWSPRNGGPYAARWGFPTRTT